MPSCVSFVSQPGAEDESLQTSSHTRENTTSRKSSRMQEREKASDRRVIEKMQRQQQKAKLRMPPQDMREANPFCPGPEMDDFFNNIYKSVAKHQRDMEHEIDNIKNTPYNNRETRLVRLIEPPRKCCDHSWRGWTCRFHPRAPPKEYWAWKLNCTRVVLGRAYCVDLFVQWKRYQQAVRALDKQRREELDLTDLAPESDFPHYFPTTRDEKKQLLGNLCWSHKLCFNRRRRSSRGKSGETCYVCRYDALAARYTEGCRAAYTTYFEATTKAIDDIHRSIGRMWFEYIVPDTSPRRVFRSSGDDDHDEEDDNNRRNKSRAVLHVSHWSEYKQGRFEGRRGGGGAGGPHDVSELAAASAERKRAVWRRMRGAGNGSDRDGYEVVEPGRDEFMPTWLENIAEEKN